MTVKTGERNTFEKEQTTKGHSFKVEQIYNLSYKFSKKGKDETLSSALLSLKKDASYSDASQVFEKRTENVKRSYRKTYLKYSISYARLRALPDTEVMPKSN